MSEEAELLGQIRKAVAEVREKGEKVIGVEALDAYLGELEDTVMLTREERARQHESQLEHFRATNA